MVSNPVANLKLAVGAVFPYPAARAAGVAIGIGTDGAGSNNSLDLLADLKAFALLQRHQSRDPAVLNAKEALELATGQRAPLLGAGALRAGRAQPTSCSFAPTPPSSASASWPRDSSTPRPATSSTPVSSRAGR